MTTAPALTRLAELAGIEEGWCDFFGTWRVVPDDTRRAFLTAMGFAADTEEACAASIRQLEDAPWRQVLDPCQVWTDPGDGQTPRISITLPAALATTPLRWSLDEGLGGQHQGCLIPADLPLLATTTRDGEQIVRHQLTLPGVPYPGVHHFRLEGLADGPQQQTLIVAPARAWTPPELRKDQTLWGVATQLYALRSDSNWGMGDYSDLGQLAAAMAPLGAATLGINPLHALFPSRPEKFSPYAPSARAFLAVGPIDLQAVPEFSDDPGPRRLYASPGFQMRLATARNSRLVDYPTLVSLKLTVLEACYKAFRHRHLGENPAEDSERGQAFRAFQQAGGTAALRFATFEALQEEALRRDPSRGWWRHWPQDWQDPDSPAVAAFQITHRERIEFFSYLQWLADGQLAAAQAQAKAAGMPLGLYRDLGVGIADDGAEAWANQQMLCLGVSVGAPPDPLNLAGQDWGLVPFHPLRLRQAGYAPLLAVLRANMAHAGAMRLDHAMLLQRLYWVPRGMKADQGAYVRYPVEDLFALVRLVSQEQRCLVIGEDLGTVPAGFRERMADGDILGYRLMAFEKTALGTFKAPADLPRQALLSFGTHDLPSLIGWWDGIDIDSRERLKLYPDPSMVPQERLERTADRHALVQLLVQLDLLPTSFPVVPGLTQPQAEQLSRAVHAALTAAPSALMMVQIEDVLALSSQMNLPGTTDQHPNWRVRLPLTIGELPNDPRFVALADSLRNRAHQNSTAPAQPAECRCV